MSRLGWTVGVLGLILIAVVADPLHGLRHTLLMVGLFGYGAGIITVDIAHELRAQQRPDGEP